MPLHQKTAHLGDDLRAFRQINSIEKVFQFVHAFEVGCFVGSEAEQLNVIIL